MTRTTKAATTPTTTTEEVMGTMWMIVADDSEARIYAVAPKRELKLLEIIEHSAGRKDPREFKSDVPGRAQSDFAGHSFGIAQRGSPKQTERDRFAASVASRVEEAIASGRANEIALVMAPRLLGLVRGHLGEHAKRAIVSEVRHRRVLAPPADILREVRASTPP